MGGSSSATNTTDIVSKAITNVLIKTSQSCSSSSGNIQSITLGPIKAIDDCKVNVGNVSNNLRVVNNLGCIQQVKTDTQLRNDIATQIRQQAESAVEGITTSESTADNITRISNEIATNINIDTMQKCVNEVYNTQTIEQQGIVCSGAAEVTLGDMVNTLVSTQVTKCMQSQENIQQLSNELQQIVSQEAEAINKGFNFFTSFTSLGLGFMAPVLSIISIILLSISSSLGLLMAVSVGNNDRPPPYY